MTMTTLPNPAATDIIFEEDPAEITVFLDDDGFGELPPFPHLFRHPLRAFGWVIRHGFGILSLIFLLAVLAVIPVVNFLALGYLLEAEGRVARSGKLRTAFHLLDVAPRIGTIVLGTWLWLIPLRLLSTAASDAMILSPGSDIARAWQVGTMLAAVLVALHLLLAYARGGSLGCFFRPLKNTIWFVRRIRSGEYWEQAERHLRSFFISLRLKHHFLLGLKGFGGGLLWLVPPTLLFAAANRSEGIGILGTIIGALGLVFVFGWMPFLQAHLAAEDRFSAIKQKSVARRIWSHAPIAAFFAVLFTYALSLPLYLLKIRLLPQDALWVMTLVFIVSIFPARIITGWAYSRGMRENKPRAHFFWRWSMRLLSIAALAFYTLMLFFVQDISEHGKLALFEHHAFLLPVPF